MEVGVLEKTVSLFHYHISASFFSCWCFESHSDFAIRGMITEIIKERRGSRVVQRSDSQRTHGLSYSPLIFSCVDLLAFMIIVRLSRALSPIFCRSFFLLSMSDHRQKNPVTYRNFAIAMDYRALFSSQFIAARILARVPVACSCITADELILLQMK